MLGYFFNNHAYDISDKEEVKNFDSTKVTFKDHVFLLSISHHILYNGISKKLQYKYIYIKKLNTRKEF